VRPKISRPREEGSINAVKGQWIIPEVNTYGNFILKNNLILTLLHAAHQPHHVDKFPWRPVVPGVYGAFEPTN
jgi:hypothetical protein